jgi:hypothetical protein
VDAREFRAAIDAFREEDKHRQIVQSDDEKRQTVQLKPQAVLLWWRELCWQLVHTTLVSQGNMLFAPVPAWSVEEHHRINRVRAAASASPAPLRAPCR